MRSSEQGHLGSSLTFAGAVSSLIKQRGWTKWPVSFLGSLTLCESVSITVASCGVRFEDRWFWKRPRQREFASCSLGYRIPFPTARSLKWNFSYWILFVSFFEHFIYFLLFKYSCLHFLPTTLPHPPSPPTLNPTPFGFVHVSLIHVPWWPFPFFPMLSPTLLPSGYCQFVLYFHVSGYILLACLFCWSGYTNRWDHMVFIFHHLAYFT